MKKKLVKAGVLILVFVAAFLIVSRITNRGTDDTLVKMGEATLPRISFEVGGQTVNHLAGYTEEMDVTAMRDTITPLDTDGNLTMKIEQYGREILGISYEVISLNGKVTYLSGEVKTEPQETMTLFFGDQLPEDMTEAVLKVILQAGNGGSDQKIYYYTRIERPDNLSVNECLSFSQNLHEKTFLKESAEEWTMYLEPGEESDNTTFQTVNIHSDVDHIQWGSLAPEVVSDVEWSIKESNSVYTSVQAKYQVTCSKEAEGTYNIREFFRVRCIEGEMYLLNYDRSMNQVFPGADAIGESGIMLGIADADIPYEMNEDGTVIAFVQERDLWVYNQSTQTLSLVFSFANAEGQDVRSRNDEHAVRVIYVDEAGNTTFAVYGYMNRGTHEGMVGAGVYYYDAQANAIEEKAFIPSTKSFAIAEEELGKMVYFSPERQLLYVLTGGVFYQIDMENNEQKVLAENLSEGQYVVSDDGRLMAYQPEGSLESAGTVTVLNLETGESYTVDAPEGETIRPLGFVRHDFICGYMRSSDRGVTLVGEEMLPMYRMEILDSESKVLKNYFQDGVYISDIFVEDNMVTVNRVVRNENVYSGTSQDYISSTEERKDTTITLQKLSTELKESQMRFTFAKKQENLEVKTLYPSQVIAEEPLTISFDDKKEEELYYVYGKGELAAIYSKAAYAIQKAEQISGVVISSEQSYIWEKGNRYLVYDTEAQPFGVAEGQTSLEACLAYMEQYNAKKIDLSGCTLNQVLYVINKGLPMIAMTDANHAILLTGYSTTDVTYVEPNDGALHTIGQNELAVILASSGNTFIGFVQQP